MKSEPLDEQVVAKDTKRFFRSIIENTTTVKKKETIKQQCLKEVLKK